MHFNMKKIGNGFTLIELLVVIAIIGLLASIVVVSLGPARQQSRDSARQADIRQIHMAMEMCYQDADCGGYQRYIGTPGGANTVTEIGTYISADMVPIDPTDVAPFQYYWTTNADPFDYYCLYARLETEDNTFFCASNKGVFKEDRSAKGDPSNNDCCGVDAIN